jgi:hypothetical protein
MTVSPGLVKKLGLKGGMKLLLFRAPEPFAALLGDLPPGVTVATDVTEEPAAFDAAVIFVRTRDEIEELAPPGIRATRPTGYLWFAYPKKTGSIRSDISRDTGWSAVYARGYRPVAQVAIDQTWTGYRFRPQALFQSSRKSQAPVD